MAEAKSSLAWIYLVAIPLVLAIFLLQDGMLLRSLSLNTGLSRAAAALDRLDSFASFFFDAQVAAQRASSKVSASSAKLYSVAESQLEISLEELQKLTNTDAATRMEFQELKQLVASQTDSWKKTIGAGLGGRVAASAASPLDKTWLPEIDQVIHDIRSQEENYLRSDVDATAHSLRATVNLFKFGGAFVLWIVVAVTLLLYYGQKTRALADLGRRVPPGREVADRLSVH